MFEDIKTTKKIELVKFNQLTDFSSVLILILLSFLLVIPTVIVYGTNINQLFIATFKNTYLDNFFISYEYIFRHLGYAAIVLASLLILLIFKYKEVIVEKNGIKLIHRLIFIKPTKIDFIDIKKIVRYNTTILKDHDDTLNVTKASIITNAERYNIFIDKKEFTKFKSCLPDNIETIIKNKKSNLFLLIFLSFSFILFIIVFYNSLIKQ